MWKTEVARGVRSGRISNHSVIATSEKRSSKPFKPIVTFFHFNSESIQKGLHPENVETIHGT